jgi:hypothetical protein
MIQWIFDGLDLQLLNEEAYNVSLWHSLISDVSCASVNFLADAACVDGFIVNGNEM